MSNYKVDKENKYQSVVQIRDLDGYDFRPRNNANHVTISKVTIVDNLMIDKILSVKFDQTFRKLIALAMKVLNDDDASDDDVRIVLDEEKLIKEILQNRYAKYLRHEKEVLFLKKLKVIENEMRMKQIAIKKKAIYLEELEKERTKGRGR